MVPARTLPFRQWPRWADLRCRHWLGHAKEDRHALAAAAGGQHLVRHTEAAIYGSSLFGVG
jgi:hypothetical protein